MRLTRISMVALTVLALNAGSVIRPVAFARAHDHRPPPVRLFASASLQSADSQKGRLVSYDWLNGDVRETWARPSKGKIPWPAPLTISDEQILRIGLAKSEYPETLVIGIWDQRPTRTSESGRKAVFECAMYPLLDLVEKACWVVPSADDEDLSWEALVKMPWTSEHYYIVVNGMWNDTEQDRLPTDPQEAQSATYLLHARTDVT